jgi:transposase-like protein
VLGWAIGASEEQASWQAFLRSLVGRGLAGVVWQRCRVHFTLAPALRASASAGVRNLLAHIPHGDKDKVAAIVRTTPALAGGARVFAQLDRAAARLQVAEVAARLEKAFPKAAVLLRSAEDDVLAYMSFPREHWTRIYSTNVLERLNREVKHRTDVVQVFPNDDAALRLAGAILLEVFSEQSLTWTNRSAGRRPFRQGESVGLDFAQVLALDCLHTRVKSPEMGIAVQAN